LRVIPGLDHHLMRYPDREAAFKESGGVPSAEPAVEAIVGWLDQVHSRGR
jgi:hypothetical protein